MSIILAVGHNGLLDNTQDGYLNWGDCVLGLRYNYQIRIIQVKISSVVQKIAHYWM